MPTRLQEEMSQICEGSVPCRYFGKEFVRDSDGGFGYLVAHIRSEHRSYQDVVVTKEGEYF